MRSRWVEREGRRRMSPVDVHTLRRYLDCRAGWGAAGPTGGFPVDAAGMRAAGHPFRCSDNGVWLTEEVPAAFLTRLTENPDGRQTEES